LTAAASAVIEAAAGRGVAFLDSRLADSACVAGEPTARRRRTERKPPTRGEPHSNFLWRDLTWLVMASFSFLGHSSV
jgi:hypothetical protein